MPMAMSAINEDLKSELELPGWASQIENSSKRIPLSFFTYPWPPPEIEQKFDELIDQKYNNLS